MAFHFFETDRWKWSIKKTYPQSPADREALNRWVRTEFNEGLMAKTEEAGISREQSFHRKRLNDCDLMGYFSRSLNHPDYIFWGWLEVDGIWQPPEKRKKT